MMSARDGRKRTSTNSETLIFLHLPKTGGNTLKSVIRRQYPKESICELHYPAREAVQEFSLRPLEERAGYRVVTGHMQLGLHEFIPGPSCYLTMLRDPVARGISAYFFVLRKPDHPRHELIRNRSLAEVLREGLLPFLDNGQTRTLCATEVQDVPYGECTRAMLDQAKDNVERHIAVAGTAARFDETLLLTKDRLGWGNVFYTRKNAAPKQRAASEPSPDVVELMREHVQLDTELYRFVEDRLDQQVAALGEPFARRLKRFRYMNRAASRLAPFLPGM